MKQETIHAATTHARAKADLYGELVDALESCLGPLQQEYCRSNEIGHRTEAAEAFVKAKNALSKAKGAK